MFHLLKMFFLSLLEQSCVVWDTRLTVENEQDFEHCQKTFCRLVLQEKYISYNNAVSNLRLQTLTERRKVLSLRFIERSLAN